MTLKSNQFIAPPIGTHYPSLKLTRQTVFKLWRERAIFMHTMTSVTFDLMTPKSNQIIVPTICIHDPSLKVIRQTVLSQSAARPKSEQNRDFYRDLGHRI